MTKKQNEARELNFAIYQLKGCLANLRRLNHLIGNYPVFKRKKPDFLGKAIVSLDTAIADIKAQRKIYGKEGE